ncbi:hypothetical protein IQ250_28200, partial [Pseudanabaenaceae cyanobacterium LEGE 13415]|nr:hypothetical protein [Pseudanabaenaceae cyanobacterium LEGE 13415]
HTQETHNKALRWATDREFQQFIEHLAATNPTWSEEDEARLRERRETVIAGNTPSTPDSKTDLGAEFLAELLDSGAADEETAIDFDQNAQRQQREEEFVRLACVESTAIFPDYAATYLEEMIGENFWGVTGQMTIAASVTTAPVWNKQTCEGFVVNVYAKCVGRKGSGKNITAKPATNLAATVTMLGKILPESFQSFLMTVTDDNGKLKPLTKYAPVSCFDYHARVSLEAYKKFHSKFRGKEVYQIEDSANRFQFGGKKGTWAGTRDAIVLSEKLENTLRPFGLLEAMNVYRTVDRAWVIDEAGVFAKEVAEDDPNRSTLTSDILREGRDGASSSYTKAGGVSEVVNLVPNVAYWLTTPDIIDMLFVRSNPNQLTNYAQNGAAPRFFYPMTTRFNSAETSKPSENFKYLFMAALWFGDVIEGFSKNKRALVKQKFTITPTQNDRIKNLIKTLNDENLPEIERFTGCKLKGLLDTDKTKQLLLASAPAFQRTAWLLEYALPYWKTLMIEYLELTPEEIENLDSHNPLEDDGWFGLGNFLEIDNVETVDEFPGYDQVHSWQKAGYKTGLQAIYQKGVIGIEYIEFKTKFSSMGRIRPLKSELEDVFLEAAIKFVEGTFAYFAVATLEALEDLSLEQKVKSIKIQKEYGETVEKTEILSEVVALVLRALRTTPISLDGVIQKWHSSKRKALNLTKQNRDLANWQNTILKEIRKVDKVTVEEDGKMSVAKK